MNTAQAVESQVELGPYAIIISNDPFDPERGKSQPSFSAGEEDLKNRYQVYGTIISGEIRQAFLLVSSSDAASSPRRKVVSGSQKNLRTVTVGDLVNGWRVEDITAQGVKLESDGEYVEVGIFDEVKEERRATAPVALQTPHPKPQVSQVPESTTAESPSTTSTGKPDFHPQRRPRERTPLRPETIDPARTSAGSEPQAETGGTGASAGPEPQSETGEAEGAPSKPNFLTPPDAPSTNPFLELIKKAREK
ncbi:MAG: hypothetical protein AVO38_02415 [delta proteobacterium ML8_D]|nr:MAG: hypothetical protein AVO38_02415 [delta proteobacterium ML8_D]